MFCWNRRSTISETSKCNKLLWKWLFRSKQRLKIFYKEYIGEEFINPFISYPDLKSKYRIQVIDIGHQVDHITPRKLQLFQEYRNYSATLDYSLFYSDSDIDKLKWYQMETKLKKSKF